VKYILLIYQNPDAFQDMPEAQRTQFMNDAGTIMNELVEAGEWIGGEGLAHPSNAKTIRVRDGAATVTDGPYLESKEHLCGYAIFDTSPERAVEIGKRWPDARHWAIELRPLMEADGADM
jgi:hypothetical protein